MRHGGSVYINIITSPGAGSQWWWWHLAWSGGEESIIIFRHLHFHWIVHIRIRGTKKTFSWQIVNYVADRWKSPYLQHKSLAVYVVCIIVILAGIRIVWVVWIVNAQLCSPRLSIDIIMPEMGKGCQALSSLSHNSSFISDQRYTRHPYSHWSSSPSLSLLFTFSHLICLIQSRECDPSRVLSRFFRPW